MTESLLSPLNKQFPNPRSASLPPDSDLSSMKPLITINRSVCRRLCCTRALVLHLNQPTHDSLSRNEAVRQRSAPQRVKLSTEAECLCVNATGEESMLKAGRCEEEGYYHSVKRDTVIGHSAGSPLTPR